MRNLQWLLLIVLISLPALTAGEEAKPDPWAQVRFMVGEWKGTTTGDPGEGTVVRKYEFVLGQRFLHERNKSTYPPQEKNKKGEAHEHWSMLSVDRARKTIVLRQFHIEGFINQYVLVAEKSTPTKLVFESENFENFSNKWCARETYDIGGSNEFTETFELAPPEKPFEIYSKNILRRVPIAKP